MVQTIIYYSGQEANRSRYLVKFLKLYHHLCKVKGIRDSGTWFKPDPFSLLKILFFLF